TNPKILRCLTDQNNGVSGHGYAAWGASESTWTGCDIYGKSKANRSDDVGSGPTTANPRNCSYLYMFNPDEANSGEVSVAPAPGPSDTDGDGNISWREYSQYMLTSSQYKGHTPVVRCLWHKNKGFGPVLNIASEDYNVYLSEESNWGASYR
ncbi:MAG: hypothetical protein ABIK20_07295, partial [Candidatus Omnitrophota bacterium]